MHSREIQLSLREDGNLEICAEQSTDSAVCSSLCVTALREAAKNKESRGTNSQPTAPASRVANGNVFIVTQLSGCCFLCHLAEYPHHGGGAAAFSSSGLLRCRCFSTRSFLADVASCPHAELSSSPLQKENGNLGQGLIIRNVTMTTLA